MSLSKRFVIVSLLAIATIAGCSGKSENPTATKTPSPKDTGTSTQPQNSEGTLRLRVTGLRNSKGQVLALLFDSKSGFPFDGDRAVRKLALTVKDGNAVGAFENLPYGLYAISVLHDENGDRKLQKNFFGIPKEGVGATGEKTYGAPKFETAKFRFTQDNPEQVIALKYY